MHRAQDVAILVGSLRKASLTRKIANALIEVAPANLRCRIIEIGDLPLYNEDLEADVPESWVRFRKEITRAEAAIFLTPEYNRSVPGCLKNALDVGSRPEGQNVWDGKSAGIVSVTPYKNGAFGANHAVRQTFVFLNMPVMQQPEAYIGGAAELFDEQGLLKNESTRQFLTTFMTSFESWVGALAASRHANEFEAFMKQRDRVAAAYSNGDASPLDAIVVTEGDANFFPPGGGRVSGAAAVKERYDRDARLFSPDNENHLEVFQSGASSELAFWTGLQSFKGKIGGNEVEMKLRITELFRLVDDEWKLFHGHAGTAAEPSKQPD